MNTDSLNKWVAILSNLGVLAGIVFLGIEIQQNSNMTQAQTRTQLTEQALQSIDIARTPDMISLFQKIGNGEELDPNDAFRYEMYIRRLFRGAENTFYQHRVGTLTESEFEGQLNFLGRTLSQQGYRDFWAEYSNDFSTEFQLEIDGLFAEMEQLL